MMNPLYTRKPLTGTLEHIVDPDDMANHQGLHCLLSRNRSSEKEIQYVLESITCDPSIYTIDHPGLIVSSIMGNYIGTERVKTVYSCFFCGNRFNSLSW